MSSVAIAVTVVLRRSQCGGMCGDQAFDERAEAGAEGGEDGRGSRFEVRGSRKGRDEGAVLRSIATKAGMTARTERVRTSPPKTPLSSGAATRSSTSRPKWRRVKSATDSSCGGRSGEQFGGAGGFGAVGGDGGRGEERRTFERGQIGGHHHVEAVGHGDEAAGGILRCGEEDVGLAGRVVGGDEFGFEAEFDGEFACPGLGGDPAIGAALDGEAAFADGFDEAAEAVGGFKQHGFDGCAVAGEAREFVGGGEAGDASSDDGDAFHEVLGSRFEVRG